MATDKNNKATDQEYNRLKHTSYQPGDSGSTPPSQSKIWPRLVKKTLVWFMIIFFVVSLVILGWSARNVSTASKQIFGSGNLLNFVPTKALDTDQSNRTNILIIGNASDRDNHGGSELTDTILILSLSEADAYMLSLPRDFYVDIPNYGAGRINEAFVAGETTTFQEAGFSSGGVGLLEHVVLDVTGLETHYTVQVNFTAVEAIVDALDGIRVSVDSPDERGIYDPNFQEFEGGPLQLSNGEQTIDGSTALRLSRARDSTGRGYGLPQSDFNRTQNQQAIVKGIMQELSWSTLLNPRTNGEILSAIADYVSLNVPMSQAIPLYRRVSQVPIEQIDTYTLRDFDGKNLLSSYTTSSGASVQIPNEGIQHYGGIRQAIRAIHQ
jgi:LCP family protein required for cell wall assembly